MALQLAETKAPAARNLNTVMEDWLSGKSKSTQVVYRSAVLEFGKFLLTTRGGSTDINSITSQDVEAFRAYLSTPARGLAHNSQTTHLRAIKSMFSYAHRTGGLPASPAQGLTGLSSDSAVVERNLSSSEVSQLFSGLSEGRDRLLAQTMYFLGLRIAEAISLDVDQFVPHDADTFHVLVNGKGGKKRRLTAPKALVKALMAIPRHSKQEDNAVFQSRYGRRVSLRRASGIIKEGVKTSAVAAGVSAHWLRHSHACEALQSGCDVKTLQASMGHSSFKTTERYLHARPGVSSSTFIKMDL
jgi:integrase/recombinase XerD